MAGAQSREEAGSGAGMPGGSLVREGKSLAAVVMAMSWEAAGWLCLQWPSNSHDMRVGGPAFPLVGLGWGFPAFTS